jgi:solute carrier family 25 citrate transporter 1
LTNDDILSSHNKCAPVANQMNVVSMAPITASQFGANRLFTQNILRKNDTDLTSAERFAGAAVAGAASAFIASPSELVIIHQQV